MGAMPYSRTIIGSIPWYSFLIVIGASLAIFLAVREEKRAGLPKDTVIDLSLWIIPFGIIGARIYYVLFAWDSFRSNPISVLYIWEGGIAIYGAVIAGFIVILIYSKVKKLSMLTLCDVLAPGLVLAQGIGRWGNYFNMEAYGETLTNPALCFFPFAVLIPEAGGAQWHMATFFYESVWDFFVFFLLIVGRRKWIRKTGDVFLSYILLYSAGRLVIEDFRMDSLYASSSVRISQLLSAVFCLVVMARFLIDVCHSAGRKHGLPVVFFCLYAVYALAVILYSLRISFLSFLSLSVRALFLSGFCLLSVISYFMIYGKSNPSEVLYADHKS